MGVYDDAGNVIVTHDPVRIKLHFWVPTKRQLWPVKYWEIIADNLSKAGWVGVESQQWILAGEQSGLQTHIATTESVSSERSGIGRSAQ
jgi:hypothetical protein